jgi:hypothetical protein
LPAALAIPVILPISPFLAGAAFFVTIVVPALVLELSLLLLIARLRPCLGGTGGPGIAAAPRLPRSVPVGAAEAAVCCPCLVAVRGALRELSDGPAMLAREAVAVATVMAGFTGEMGRARYDFPGDEGALSGGCGSCRELCDLGERILDGSTTLRDVARPARAAGAAELDPATILLRFLGMSMSMSMLMFSLSEPPIISLLYTKLAGALLLKSLKHTLSA